MKVLLLDDDQVILSMLRAVLTKWGHKVSTYADADQCPVYCSMFCPCTLIKNGCPDCILTDVNMPTINGLKFVEEIKRKSCKCPKIGMMSGDWNEIDLGKATHMGATIFSKPFDIQRLFSWVSADAGFDRNIP